MLYKRETNFTTTVQGHLSIHVVQETNFTTAVQGQLLLLIHVVHERDQIHYNSTRSPINTYMYITLTCPTYIYIYTIQFYMNTENFNQQRFREKPISNTFYLSKKSNSYRWICMKTPQTHCLHTYNNNKTVFLNSSPPPPPPPLPVCLHACVTDNIGWGNW